jgi:hypothetical protein
MSETELPQLQSLRGLLASCKRGSAKAATLFDHSTARNAASVNQAGLPHWFEHLRGRPAGSPPGHAAARETDGDGHAAVPSPAASSESVTPVRSVRSVRLAVGLNDRQVGRFGAFAGYKIQLPGQNEQSIAGADGSLLWRRVDLGLCTRAEADRIKPFRLGKRRPRPTFECRAVRLL